MSRSRRVRPDLVPRVKSSVKRNGFLRQQDLVEAVGLASSTVRNFLNGKPVDYATFEEICQKLNLEWRDFADWGEIIDTPDLAEREKAIANPHQETIESDPGSIEERYFRATSNFDSLEPLERKSRIQVLEEIASNKDFPRYHWKVMEFLADFVRRKAPRKEEEEGNEERSPKLPEDIQAALTVIGGRNTEKDPENQKLDLSNIDLRGAILIGAKLQRAILSKANLQDTDLREAKLQGADLTNANLQRAKLWGAELEKANLQGANLERAVLNGAELQGARLDGANLKYAYLWYVKLQQARLDLTNLEGAILKEAQLQGASLDGANLKGAFFNRADLEGVILEGADLKEADLSESRNLKSWQIAQAQGNNTTILPDYVERPANWI